VQARDPESDGDQDLFACRWTQLVKHREQGQAVHQAAAATPCPCCSFPGVHITWPDHVLQLAAKQPQLAMRLFLACCMLWPLCDCFAAQAFAMAVGATIDVGDTLAVGTTLAVSSCHQAAACSASDLCVCMVRQGKVGLTRGDNACYQNSMLQALCMVPGLVDYFLTTPVGCEGLTPLCGDSQVVASLGQLFKSMRSAAPGTVVSTSG